MNVEDNYDSPQEQPKKSGRGLFACGGVGCILLILICGGGIAAVFMMFSPLAQTMQQAQTMVQENAQVIAALGEPIEIGQQPAQRTDAQGDEFKFGMDFPISGPKGSGTMKMDVVWKSFSEWAIESLTVEVDDGETIDVLNSDEFDVDIDDGAEEAADETE